uniref:Uncharacterized protein n=1 Tax=Meloidogyne enterolobii TaxID=390850 RepID=A0A6V7VNH3_MELEN|nr:unnamed protein product [Meloidogyne enterolobii]
MTEGRLSTDSDLESKETENNLEIKFVEKKILNLEKKNFFLENKLKEMDKKIQKINCEHKNEIEEMKQNFHKLIEEKFQQLKTENDICLKKKDEKINFLEEEIKKVKDLSNQNTGDLIKLKNLNCVNFVEIKNKWSEIDGQCCDKNCINTNRPIGNCIEGCGFVNIINEEIIIYLVGNGGWDNIVLVYTENSFNKPQNCVNYSLHYFEVKCIFEGELRVNRMSIGLKNLSTDKCIFYSAKDATIKNEKTRRFRLPTLSFNNNDIFGCGLVYPPNIKTNEEFPYVFFTQNGKQIGKATLLKDNSDSFKPYVMVVSCSVEANFGNDLETKPFKYDVSKHLILEEFY